MYNIGKVSRDSLEVYFEHKRSRGDTVKHVQIFPAEDYAIVTFEKYGGLNAGWVFVVFF